MDISSHSKKVENEIRDYLNKKSAYPPINDLSENPAPKNKKRMVIVGFIILLVLAVIAYFSYVSGHGSYSKEKVGVSIDIASEIASGEEVSFTIDCKNENKVDLTNAKLEIFFPNNFTFRSSDQTIDLNGSAHYWHVGNVSAQGSKKIRIYGSIIGKVGDERYIRAILTYTPSNFNSTFQAEGNKTVTITSTPVELNLSFPESIKDSSESELAFSYKNKGSRSFEKAKLIIDFPVNFVFASSEPALSKVIGSKNSYMLEEDSFKKDFQRTVKVRGSFQSQSENETVTAKVYLMEENKEMTEYAEESKSIKMEKTDILLYQTINGEADYSPMKNEELTYKITFKNQSGKDIKGLVVKSVLDGSFEPATVKAEKGTVNGGEIVWSAIQVPELGLLAPGTEASVVFTVKVPDRFSILKDTDKNFTIRNLASISSYSSDTATGTEVTMIAKNENEGKIKSFLFIDTKGFFNDDGRIVNGGALPPKVGETTYYTIHWSLKNLFNDTENVRVKAVLPAGVQWTGRYIDAKGAVQSAIGQSGVTATANNEKITAERVFYEESSNSVIWEIPSLRANDGVLTSTKEIVFQIGLTPGATEAGAIMPILNATSVSGHDTFTESDATGMGAMLTTDLTATDFSISDNEAIVKE